ncbi:hypothetical protein PTNB73_05743 [Pyrenophora teres f. teres]|nr:hypothetical protein HRS9122_05496 [Pyrenophora teres f. teres]KAE8864855.1 hypothetical protein PTNB73_05743 [Pyrenophora teres f. teres]
MPDFQIQNLAVPSVYLLILFLGYPSQYLLMHLEPRPLSEKEIWAANVLLMHPKNGPPLPLDKQLRIHHNLSSLPPLPPLHYRRPLPPPMFPLPPPPAPLEQPRPPLLPRPHPLQLAHLFTILIANTLTLFVLAVLLLRNIWCLAVNTTTIEGWEIERHRTLVRRARQFGGYLAAPDGVKVRIRKQEFPYDIGIWSNIVEGMGSRNPLNWFNPFARTMPLERGLRFETNGFESEDKVWPPPDPERNYRRSAVPVDKDAFRFVDSTLSREDEVKAFKERQAEDAVRRRRGYEERIDFEVEEEDEEGVREEDEYGYGSDEAEEEEEPRKNKLGDDERENVAAWRNSEGERLKDFGVDEDVEFYDEQDDDDVPLSELLARKRAASMSTHQNLS